MSKLRINSCDEFETALRAVPFAEARLAVISAHVRRAPGDRPDLRPYGLWSALLELVHDAIAQRDWKVVRELLQLYDAVERVGRQSEMYEASYVAFLEDVGLPTDRSQLRAFWRHAPPTFTEALRRDRRLR